jgi:integrase
MFTRTRYQNGSLEPKERMNGERMWEFRFYETDSQGERQRRAVTVGSLSDFPTESAARKSPVVQALLLRINAEGPQAGIAPPSFGAVIARYEQGRCQNDIQQDQPINRTSRTTSGHGGPIRRSTL